MEETIAKEVQRIAALPKEELAMAFETQRELGLFGVLRRACARRAAIFVAGLGHWLMGALDWSLLATLLIGSLPGIAIGSHLAAVSGSARIAAPSSAKHAELS